MAVDAAVSNADPPAGEKAAENGDAATNSTSGGDSLAGSPAKKAVASSRSEPTPYVYDPKKITIKFVFANRDGLNVIVDCKPTDTVGEVKGALLSMWPEGMPACSGGDKIRLICMGKGMLSPDTKSLEACDVPVFKTHSTPVNVAVRPEVGDLEGGKKKKNSVKKNNPGTAGGGGANNADRASRPGEPQSGSSGCSCVIM